MFYNTIAASIKERGRKRKQRDFYGDFVAKVPKVLKVPKVRTLMRNNKDMINNYVRDVSAGGHVFTLEDPDKWRTTDTLERAGIRVVAV